MGKNDYNRYDTNKKYADSERRKEKRIKSPVSTGSKRSREKDMLRKVTSKITSSKDIILEDEFEDDFDDAED